MNQIQEQWKLADYKVHIENGGKRSLVVCVGPPVSHLRVYRHSAVKNPRLDSE
jgi:hypothetical protein